MNILPDEPEDSPQEEEATCIICGRGLGYGIGLDSEACDDCSDDGDIEGTGDEEADER